MLEAARAEGFEVPRDLSLVGFDDLEVAPYVGLTTIAQPLYESGRRGLERLLDVVAGDDDGPLTERLELRLVVRRTTASPNLAAMVELPSGRTAWARNLAAPVRDFLSTETAGADGAARRDRRRARVGELAVVGLLRVGVDDRRSRSASAARASRTTCATGSTRA